MSNKNTPSQNDASLPLFYKTPELLRAEEHEKCGLSEPNGYAFTKDCIAIPIGVSEFIPASKYYPIVFASGQPTTPLAVIGIKQGQNLFLNDDNSWLANTYIPAYVRRYPFIVTETPDGSSRLLAIDTSADRYIESVKAGDEKYRLFDDNKGPTELAKSAMAFCHAFHEEHLRTIQFCKDLEDAKLLVPNHANMEFPDGSRYTLDGFSVIDEKVLMSLSEKTVYDWHKKGWLNAVALHFSSRQNWQELLDLNAKRNPMTKG